MQILPIDNSQDKKNSAKAIKRSIEMRQKGIRNYPNEHRIKYCKSIGNAIRGVANQLRTCKTKV